MEGMVLDKPVWSRDQRAGAVRTPLQGERDAVVRRPGDGQQNGSTDGHHCRDEIGEPGLR